MIVLGRPATSGCALRKQETVVLLLKTPILGWPSIFTTLRQTWRLGLMTATLCCLEIVTLTNNVKSFQSQNNFNYLSKRAVLS